MLCHSTGQSVVKMAYLIDPSNGSGSLLVRAPLGDTKDQTWLPNGGCNIHSVYLELGNYFGLMHHNRSLKWIWDRLYLFDIQNVPKMDPKKIWKWLWTVITEWSSAVVRNNTFFKMYAENEKSCHRLDKTAKNMAFNKGQLRLFTNSQHKLSM